MAAALLTSLLVCLPATAQEASEVDTLYSLGHSFRTRIKRDLRGFSDLVYEEQVEPGRFFGAKDDISMSGGVSYDLNSRLRIEGGLGFYYTYLPEATDTSETRLWQAITLDWPDSPGVFRRFVLSHRVRLEERFFSDDDQAFSARLRYRLSYSIPLNRYTVEPGAFFIPLTAEYFATLGDDAPGTFAARAHFTGGIGYVFNKIWTARVRYARRTSRDTIDADFNTTGHAIEFRVGTSIGIRDLVKSR